MLLSNKTKPSNFVTLNIICIIIIEHNVIIIIIIDNIYLVKFEVSHQVSWEKTKALFYCNSNDQPLYPKVCLFVWSSIHNTWKSSDLNHSTCHPFVCEVIETIAMKFGDITWN